MHMEQTIRDRIIIYSDTTGVKKAKLCNDMQVCRSYLQNVREIPMAKVELLLRCNPSLSRQWLILGVGDMLVGEATLSKHELLAAIREKERQLEESRTALIESQKTCAMLIEQLKELMHKNCTGNK